MNLILSCLAAIQAPIIMMSQNRSEARDRARAENDYKVNLKDAPQAGNAQVTDKQVEEASNAAAATAATGGLSSTQQLVNQAVSGGGSSKPAVRPEDGATRGVATTPVNNGDNRGCQTICEGLRNFRR